MPVWEVFITYEQGKLDDAISEYQQAVEIDPNHLDANFSLGGIYRKQGKLEDAIATFQQAIQIEVDLNFAPTWINECQGVIYLIQGKLDDAITEFQQALKSNAEDLSIIYNLACVYSLKNEKQTAIEYL